ncbi:y4mF family transcriptional regulator [Arthrobacter sp. JUb119]|uniref:helix-turn-helix transcriptional regulator n=1 Tax=Micrococcaceae TaxID=1268 RepID=UPI000F98D906|nr:helix-turn-helix transcriptional regulator [Arthrobacter sp. JUb115]MCS3493567.1 y4mF family transcriptional regulator [Arthrobacter sp. JUb119]TDU18215.1 y4mF family transcriptional regulator [Arthrobacter sp. JUb115]
MKTPSFTVGSLADKIRTQRGFLGLTQAALANSVGVSRKFIVDLEAGKETVALGLVLRVLKRLGFEEPGLRIINDRGAEIAEDFRQTLEAKNFEFALRLISEYSTESLEAGRPLLAQSPELEDSQYQVALAAITKWIAGQTNTPVPQWTSDIVRPTEPVFLSEKLYPVGEKMKELIRAETPPALQELNVWIRQRSLGTA